MGHGIEHVNRKIFKETRVKMFPSINLKPMDPKQDKHKVKQTKAYYTFLKTSDKAKI